MLPSVCGAGCAQCPSQDDCGGRRYGLAAGAGMRLVCEYGEDGSDPEIILYKMRRNGT